MGTQWEEKAEEGGQQAQRGARCYGLMFVPRIHSQGSF